MIYKHSETWLVKQGNMAISIATDVEAGETFTDKYNLASPIKVKWTEIKDPLAPHIIISSLFNYSLNPS